MKQSRWFLWVLLLSCVLMGCVSSVPETSDSEFSEGSVDSLRFLESHHYSINYNFVIVSDSVILASAPQNSDSLMLYRGDFIVVADYCILPKDSVDSVYLKVARDQETFGWIQERKLLNNVTPDDPISEFIYLFSHTHLVWFLLLLGLAVLNYLYRVSLKKPLQIVHFRDIDSPYPAVFCILVAISAAFYGSIQHFSPESWVQFYFHPTLNPFELPFGLACFITSVWGLLILLIAVLDEVFRKLPLSQALDYLVGMAAICVVCYIFFTFSTPYYIGYLFLVAYIGFALSHILCLSRWQCGACGSPMPYRKGRCPHCGAQNE